jgi:hypothetical protein
MMGTVPRHHLAPLTQDPHYEGPRRAAGGWRLAAGDGGARGRGRGLKVP